MTRTNERRRHPRVEILGRVKGAVRPLDVPITLLNLSLGGCLMQTPKEYHVGEIHEFQLTMGKKEPLVVRARIAHAMRATVDHKPVYLLGLEFVDRDTSTADKPLQLLMSALTGPPGSTSD